MISVEEAKNIILNSTKDFGVGEIPFLKSVGRILKEDISADRDFPPFNRVAMDGIAIDFNQFQNGQRAFTIEGIQPAGSPQLTLQDSRNCIEVMTGAILPNNTNAVIRYEDILTENGIATIQVDAIKTFQNIHQQGTDKPKGEILIEKNSTISAAEIGVLSTVGKSTVKVAKQPKVMILTTGDELVDVDQEPLAHQIRKSNVFTLVSLLERINVSSDIAHITDDKPILKEKIAGFLKDYDVLMCSGAVSKGKYDFLPEVFDELGVEKLFHRIAQRPGKPFWFGHTESCKVFAFPGNPVSTYVNSLVYFYPWFYKSCKVEVLQETAILTEDVFFKPNLTYFLQVKLSDKFGHVLATPVKANGSGDLASLVHADAFIQLPKTEETLFKQGDNFPVMRFR